MQKDEWIMSASEFLYYTLLKHGKIIVVVMGAIIAVLVFMYIQKFGIGFKTTTENSVKYCEDDLECFDYCGDCVAVKSTKYCAPNNSVKCACINNSCSVV